MNKLVLAGELEGLVKAYREALKGLDLDYEFSDDARAYRKGKENLDLIRSYCGRIPNDLYVKYWNEQVVRNYGAKKNEYLITEAGVEKSLDSRRKTLEVEGEKDRVRLEKKKREEELLLLKSNPRVREGKVFLLEFLGGLLVEYKCGVKEMFDEEVPRLFISHHKYPIAWMMKEFGFELVKKGKLIQTYRGGKFFYGYYDMRGRFQKVDKSEGKPLLKDKVYLRITERDGGVYFWLSDV